MQCITTTISRPYNRFYSFVLDFYRTMNFLSFHMESLKVSNTLIVKCLLLFLKSLVHHNTCSCLFVVDGWVTTINLPTQTSFLKTFSTFRIPLFMRTSQPLPSEYTTISAQLTAIAILPDYFFDGLNHRFVRIVPTRLQLKKARLSRIHSISCLG